MKKLPPILSAYPLMACLAIAQERPRADVAIDHFDTPKNERWTVEGDAFQWMPARDKERERGVEGAGFLTSGGKGGPASIGSWTSPAFTVERDYINLKLGGTRDLASTLGAELLVDGKVWAQASGSDEKDPAQALYWRTFRVRELQGRTVQLRLNDRSTTGMLAVDQLEQSDTRRAIALGQTQSGREELRPRFHFTAARGWLNDANGMVWVAGVWHLFHQYRAPGERAVGWGHATSRDLLHWTYQPVALPPQGNDSIFSGAGAVDWQNSSHLQEGAEPPLLFAYTLHPADPARRATQALAYSVDGGKTFRQHAGNPVLQTPDFHDRDPKIFFYAPKNAWYMVLSLSRNNTQRDLATYGLFRSRDLQHWDLLQEIGPGPWYWECPDMFELPVENALGVRKWVLTKGSGDYLVGSFDGERFQPETEPIRIQWGGSFYGAQTFADSPGDYRVQIAWMNSGPTAETPNAYLGMPFNQQMSFPRELRLRQTPEGPRLFRKPSAAIAQLYDEERVRPVQPLLAGSQLFAAEDYARELDLSFSIRLGQARKIHLLLGGEPVVYDAPAQKLTAFGRTMPWPAKDGVLRVRALLDRTSLELFGNDGELTHAGVFFHDREEQRHALTAEGAGAQLESFSYHTLKPAWPSE